MLEPITKEQQDKILSDIRALVPDSARGKGEKRHALVLGAVVALQSIDHGLVPPHWLMNVLAGASDRLFKP
jgi:hypothetical protein